MLRLIANENFVEGRWRNGMGVSWEIASHKEPGADDFSWRLAKARIDADVPFSIYPNIDRIFMQLSGNGLDLEFEGGQVLQVHEKFVPHSFACDVGLRCTLRDGPCFDLNLFTARGKYAAEAVVLKLNGMETVDLTGVEAVFFNMQGNCVLSGAHGALSLQEGDAVVADAHQGQVTCAGRDSAIFVGILQRI